MKKMLATTLFMLAALAWAAAQQPGTTSGSSSGQAASPSSQSPSQSQPSTPAQAGQTTAPGHSPGQAANAPVTEGCLGGSNPNFTLTDSAGTSYKLNIPPNADTSVLAQHLGESVAVAGNVNSSAKSIDVQGIGRGNGKCLGKGSTAAPPKQ